MKTPGENNSVTKFVFQNYILKVKEMRRILFLAVAMTVIGIFTEVKLTEILKDIPEYFQDEDKFRILIVELAIFGLIYSFSSELTGYFVAGPLQTIFTKSMKDSLKAYINLNYTTFKEVGVGKILKNMDRISSSTGELIAVVINQILPIPIFIFFLSISILRNISLLVLTIISFHIFLYIIFTFKITDLRTKLRRIANEELNKTNNISNEILCNYEGIKAFNNETYELERFDKQLKKIIKPTRKLWQSLYFLNLVQKNVLICMDIVICILFFVKRNDPSITNQKIVIQYFLITNIIRKKFSNLGSTYGMFMIMHTNIKTSMMPESQEELGDEIKFKEQIKFQNVSLSNTDKDLLTNLNFVINKGDKIAIIGSNGCGKPTFIRALLGFYDYNGNIFIDDKELRNISKRSLRNNISFVPQDSCLMNESVKENICYGDKINDEDIYNICNKYNVNNSFERLEEGYLTKIGERGKNLSGGEKQKVALIRAAIRNKPIFILDEPTASMDSLSEKHIFKILTEKNDITVLTIVHNLDLLPYFSKILHFEKNTATLYGSYQEFHIKNTNEIDFYKHLALSTDKLNKEV